MRFGVFGGAQANSSKLDAGIGQRRRDSVDFGSEAAALCGGADEIARKPEILHAAGVRYVPCNTGGGMGDVANSAERCTGASAAG